MIHAWLVAASAIVILSLGLAHLWLTFVGSKLHPRSTDCRSAMESTHPVLTRQTTLWRAWVGFNASHSLGAILFGLVYGYLGALQPNVLFASPFLLAVGAVFLGGYIILGRRYWFSTPLAGILLAAALYVCALVAARSG